MAERLRVTSTAPPQPTSQTRLRGREARPRRTPGRHEPILTEAEYRRTTTAIAARTRVGNKPRPFRQYVLRGLIVLLVRDPDARRSAPTARHERRYYRCPTLGCRARRVRRRHRAGGAGAIASGVLPASVIDAARGELRRLLETPEVASAGRQRARLQTRLEQLKKQHGWGDLSDADYQAARDAARSALAELPDGDRIRTFDAYRTRVLALPEAIDAASPARREELSRIVVERVVTRLLSEDDPLAWYVA